MGYRALASEKPFLSSSKIIENYSLLLKYVEKCKFLNIDCSPILPSSSLLSQIENLVKTGRVGFEEVVRLVEEKMSSAIICDVCIQAFREVYGIEVDCERAKKMLIAQIAGWLVEILDTLGYIRIRYSWKP